MAQFLSEMLADTQKAKIALIEIYQGLSDGRKASAHVYYEWFLADETLTTFEGVILFNFDSDLDKIKKLTLIYDTSHTSSFV